MTVAPSAALAGALLLTEFFSREALAISIRGAAQPAPYWPFKGGNLNHSGASPFSGPFDLSKPKWVWEEPDREKKGLRNNLMKVFHSSPVIDGDLNVYIQSTTGWVYSLNSDGRLRWQFETSSGNPANLAVQNGAVYTISDDGVAFAIEMSTGKEIWRSKVAKHAPDDTHSLTVSGETLLTACNVGRDVTQMSDGVCALRISDGQVLWKYSMMGVTGRPDAVACNQQQNVVQGKAIFSDDFGGLYCVSVKDGEQVWLAENATSITQISLTNGMAPYGTTATSAVGSNDMIYHPFNMAGGHGILRAHSIHNGALQWHKPFNMEINVAPAVGSLRPGGPLVVVVALGRNPLPMAANPVEQQLFKLHVIKPVEAKVVALDANTGATVWTFTAPEWDGRCAGSVPKPGSGDLCAPDAWGTPAIGADGVVYMNWSGGYAFALRDADGDGVINREDPLEVSSYHHGHGANGETAIAPNFIVAPSCRKLVAFGA